MILAYVREDIPSKLLAVELSNREGFLVKINLRKSKWVLCLSYNPQNSFIITHTESIGKVIDPLSAKYEEFYLSL